MRWTTFAAAFLCSSCLAAQPRPGFDRIEHLIFLVQPARSFDSLFGTYENVEGAAVPGTLDYRDIQNYWEYARLYVIQDRFFASGRNPLAITSRLDNAGLRWKLYTDPSDFDRDCRDGTLPPVSWMFTPPGPGIAAEMEYTTDRINALMRSRSWWRSAIFLAWAAGNPDSPDHVNPPDGLGARLPSIVIGPYARSTFHDHRTYSLESWDRTIETRFNLAPSTSVPDLYDAFDFAQEAREPVLLEGAARPWPPWFQVQHHASSWLANVHSCYGTWTLSPGILVDGYINGSLTEPIAATVTDSGGVERAAQILYAGPNQVNFVIPEETADGVATVAIKGRAQKLIGTALIERVSPGLYSTTQMGQGPAPAWITRDGRRTPAFECDDNHRCSLIPIELEGEPLVLTLYGTGFRNRSSLQNVQVHLGDLSLQPIYAGPNEVFSGVDEIRLELPPSLRGRGQVLVSLTVDGRDSNAVQLEFR